MATIIGIDDGTASRRQNDVIHLRQVVDCGSLAFAKPLFSFLFENERNIDARPRLNLVIAIDESQVQRPRKLPPDGGLAGTHRADEENVFGLLHIRIWQALKQKANPKVGFR
jgi:hypothetical protein